MLYSFDHILNIFEKEENKNKFKEIINKFNINNNEGIKEDNLMLEKKRKRNLEHDNDHKDELIDKGKKNDNIKNNRKITIKLDKKEEEKQRN